MYIKFNNITTYLYIFFFSIYTYTCVLCNADISTVDCSCGGRLETDGDSGLDGIKGDEAVVALIIVYLYDRGRLLVHHMLYLYTYIFCSLSPLSLIYDESIITFKMHLAQSKRSFSPPFFLHQCQLVRLIANSDENGTRWLTPSGYKKR